MPRHDCPLVATTFALAWAMSAGAALAAAGPPPAASVNGTGPTPGAVPAPTPPPSPGPTSPPAPTPTPSGAGPTVMCRFASGPKAGRQARVATPVPTPVGGTCQDGAGSIGVVAASDPAAAAAR
ncbi:MAG TPA: hypothetical protein VGF50_01315 [Caulobacteraceae bacterium]